MEETFIDYSEQFFGPGGMGSVYGGMGSGYVDPAAMNPGGQAVVDKVEDGPGFVVTIEGYSPYKNIGDLLDPIRVGKNKDNWGIVTWFENFNKNSPFKMYVKNDNKHFKQDTGDVKYKDKDMPIGIGEVKDIQRFLPPEKPKRRGGYGGEFEGGGYKKPMHGNLRDKVEVETVLVDPMTREEMSKTIDYVTQQEVDSDPSLDADDLGKIKIDLNGEPKYITRDHWFRINVKFLWTGAPEELKKSATRGSGQFGGRYSGVPGGGH